MWCNYEKWNEVREKTFGMEYMKNFWHWNCWIMELSLKEMVEVSSLEWVKSGEKHYESYLFIDSA